MTPNCSARVVTDVNVQEYFQSALEQALNSRSVIIQGETTVYLIHLLLTFIRAERLFDDTADGPMLRPLAAIYGDAVDARSSEARVRSLQRLGDIALFIAGLYAHSLSRSLVDVDYYISMGESAYGSLADGRGCGPRSHILRDVFYELAERFSALVDVLAEVGDVTNLTSSNDVLRLYEIWLRCGSPRAAEKLRQLGIEPVPLHGHRH